MSHKYFARARVLLPVLAIAILIFAILITSLPGKSIPVANAEYNWVTVWTTSAWTDAYSGHINGLNIAVGGDSAIYYSSDGGSSFSSVLSQIAYTMDGTNTEVWATTDDGMYVSNDSGATWTEANDTDGDAFPDGDTIYGMNFETTDLIYVANFDDNSIQCSDDAGVTWYEVYGITAPRGIRHIGDNLYVIADGGLVYITMPDNCDTSNWGSPTEASNETWDNAYDLYAFDNGDIIVATEDGIYRSANFSTWTRDDTSVANRLFKESDTETYLLAGTAANGVKKYDTSTHVWATYGSNLLVADVRGLIQNTEGATQYVYAFGLRNGSTNYGTWKNTSNPTAVQITGNDVTQDFILMLGGWQPSVSLTWSTATEMDYMGAFTSWQSPKTSTWYMSSLYPANDPGSMSGNLYKIGQPSSSYHLDYHPCLGTNNFKIRVLEPDGTLTDYSMPETIQYDMMTSFSGSWNAGTNQTTLNWATGDQYMINSFTIYRKNVACNDVGRQITVATVNATGPGMGTGQNYSYVDTFTLHGVYACYTIVQNAYYSSYCNDVTYPTNVQVSTP